MFVQENVFRNAVTVELVDQCGLIKPLASLILDFALPTWTWNFDSDEARDIAVLNATGQSITTRHPSTPTNKFQLTDLKVAQPLNPGDSMMFVFDGLSHSYVYITIRGEMHSDGLALLADENTIRVRQVGTTGIRERPDGSFKFNVVFPEYIGEIKGKQLKQVAGIVLSRNNHEVRMRLMFHQDDETPSCALHTGYQLSIGEADEILYVAIAFCISPGCRYDPYTITLANAIERK